MADQDTTNFHALCANDEDEIEGLNEKLLQLLSGQKVPSQNVQSIIHQPLGDVNTIGDSPNVNKEASVSPLHSHYKHDYSFLHYDSPANLSSSPKYLPPIGVFWDIENCHVSIKLNLMLVQM